MLAASFACCQTTTAEEHCAAAVHCAAGCNRRRCKRSASKQLHSCKSDRAFAQCVFLCAVPASDQQQPRVWLKRSATSVSSTDEEAYAEPKRARHAAPGGHSVTPSAAIACELPVRPIDMLHAWRGVGSLGPVLEPLATVLVKVESQLVASSGDASSSAAATQRPLHALLCDEAQEEDDD